MSRHRSATTKETQALSLRFCLRYVDLNPRRAPEIVPPTAPTSAPCPDCDPLRTLIETFPCIYAARAQEKQTISLAQKNSQILRGNSPDLPPSTTEDQILGDLYPPVRAD